MSIFTNMEFVDRHFVYDFCDGNSLASWREYQLKYPDWKEPYQHVLETVHYSLRETATLMLTFAMKDIMYRMRRMYWISYITHWPALIRFLLQQEFPREKYGILCMTISCVLSIYKQCKGCSHRTNISTSSSCNKCYTRLWTPLSLCCGLMQYLQEVVCTIHTNLNVWAMENPHATHHFSL